MSFDWQTETTSTGSSRPAATGRRIPDIHLPWRWLVVGLVALSAVYLAFRSLGQRAGEAIDSVEDEVIASHRLIQRAAQSGDVELFSTFLSGRDPTWSAAQEQRVREKSFHELASLGLRPDPSQDAAGKIRVNLDANLNSAEVMWNQAYTFDIGNGLTEAIILEHTAVFRPGPDRWLLAPPEQAFWGEQRFEEGLHLALNFPERDEQIGQRLFLDIDEKLGEMCARLRELQCPQTFMIVVELVTDPAVLAENTDPGLMMSERGEIQLPAPSLVGLPIDEPGYRALYRAYASQVVSRTIPRLVDWHCCDSERLFTALLNHQLRQLGLRPASLAPDDYQRYHDERVMLADLEMWWSGIGEADTPSDEQRAAILAEFIEKGMDVPSAAAQRILARAERPDFWELLTSFDSQRENDEQALERTWAKFVFDNSTAGRVRPPISQPAQDLALACMPSGRGTLFLYRYDISADEMKPELNLMSGWAWMLGLPYDEGVVFSTQGSGTDSTTSLLFLEHGIKTRISWSRSADAPDSQPIFIDPSDRLLLVGNVVETLSPYGVMDIAGCRDPSSECLLDTLSGFPVWSPDGSHAIMVSGPEHPSDDRRAPAMLSLADALGERIRMLGIGASPFWMDEGSFGLVVDDAGEEGQTVSVASIDGEQSERLLTASDLKSALPESAADGAPFIDYVAAHPLPPNQLLMVTAGSSSGVDYLMSYDIEAKSVLKRTEIVDGALQYQRGYRLSPDGRWLLISGPVEEDGRLHLMLYDVMTERTLAFRVQSQRALPVTRSLDWSADGRWLVFVEGGIVRLMAPEHSYERMIAPRGHQCTTAVWTNKE